MSIETQEVVGEEIQPTLVEETFVTYVPTPEEKVAYITSVKIMGENYLVNGSMTVPESEDNVHYQDIKIWKSLGNVPEPQFNDKELEENRINKIKVRASEIINGKYPAYKQLNASLGVYSKSETDSIKNFIKDIRDQSNKLELDPTKTADDFVIGA